MLMGVAATINAMAVDYTAKANLLLEATSGEDCDLYLRQSNSYSALGGYDMNMTNREVALYAISGEQKLQMAQAPAISNLALGLKTDASTSYTITVSGVAGDEVLVLFDLETQEQYNLTEGNVINFSITGDERNSTIEDRFVINYQAPAPVYAAEVTTNAQGLATFSFQETNLVPVEADVKLYKGIFSSLDENLGLQSVSAVDQGEGVIVYGTPNTTYHFEASADQCGEFDGNDLKASSLWASRGNGYIYVLSGDALYLYEGTEFPAKKAFLEVPASNGAPRRIGFAFDNATAIDNVEATVKAEKFIENGQVLIKRGEAVYNLQGQIVK